MADWSDPRRKVLALQTELKRLRARAERWGAPATAAALEDALARSDADLGGAQEAAATQPGPI